VLLVPFPLAEHSTHSLLLLATCCRRCRSLGVIDLCYANVSGVTDWIVLSQLMGGEDNKLRPKHGRDQAKATGNFLCNYFKRAPLDTDAEPEAPSNVNISLLLYLHNRLVSLLH
jgi:hypothetical protein